MYGILKELECTELLKKGDTMSKKDFLILALILVVFFLLVIIYKML